jgi:hypothetical protein
VVVSSLVMVSTADHVLSVSSVIVVSASNSLGIYITGSEIVVSASHDCVPMSECSGLRCLAEYKS